MNELIRTLELIPTESLYFYSEQRRALRNQVRAGSTRGSEIERLNRDLFPPSCDVVFTIRPEFAINSLPDMQASVVRVIGG